MQFQNKLLVLLFDTGTLTTIPSVEPHLEWPNDRFLDTRFFVFCFVFACKRLRILGFRNLLMAEGVDCITTVHGFLPCTSVYGCHSGLRN